MGALSVLGQAHRNEQQYELAKRCFREALLIAESFRHPLSIAGNYNLLARIAKIEGDNANAHKMWRQALQQYWRAGYKWIAPYPLQNIAELYVAQDDFERAVMILGVIHPRLINKGRTDRKAQALYKELEARMEPERFAAAWERGQERTLNSLVNDLLAELEFTRS